MTARDRALDGRRGRPLEGWSPFDEELLLRAVHVDLVRRTVGFSVTYDDYVFEGAPTGDWRVELEDASPITMTRLAVDAGTRSPGRISMVHQAGPVGRGVFQVFSDEVLVNTVGSELPATREERLPAKALLPVQASANHTNWSFADWDDDGQPWDLELRAFTFDIDASALLFDVREHSRDPRQPVTTHRTLSLDGVDSFSISVRYPHSASAAVSVPDRIEEAYVDGRTYYLHHPVVTLSATVAAFE